MTARVNVPEWLQEVPDDWETPYLKLVAKVESGHTPSRGVEEYWVPDECTTPWFTLADIWQLRDGKQKFLGDTKEMVSLKGLANSSARILPAGTVVLSRTASVGFSGVMPRPMATTQDFVNFVPGPRILSDYLLWVLRGMTPEFDRLRMGSTHKTIYMPDVLEFRTPVPPKPKQRAIADFLDRKTAAIDGLIEKKERLIELLQEKRQALITQAVTKGLDPTVPMKDSGVEWIGEIPAHWEVQATKRLFEPVIGGLWGGGPGETEVDVACIRVADFDRRSATTNPDEPTIRSVSRAQAASRGLRQGDLLLEKSGGGEKQPVGFVVEYVGDGDAIFSNFVARLRPRPGVESGFARNLMNALYLARINVKHIKQTTGIQNLDVDSFLGELVALPPPVEARAIADTLESAQDEVLGLLGSIHASIALLREYRQALITNAVTGQLDIPGAA